MELKIKELSFRYRNSSEKVLDQFHLSVSKGEIVSILGDSGSGKSTVLRLIAGLEIPKIGTITLKESILVDAKNFILPEKRGIGMVFQDYALFPHLTVANNVLFGIKHLRKADRFKRMDEMLELVEMGEYKKRYPYELSGGQQQRVALARAIAPKPSILLLDEPFSNLDTALQMKIRRDVKNILKKANMTSIFVTHDREDVLDIADRVVVLKHGKIVKSGAPKDILA
ncbi:MAG: ABC transporter [Alkaliphilus sp.]|nr:MAG: ABC transporter [Alkaliphilus sp.]